MRTRNLALVFAVLGLAAFAAADPVVTFGSTNVNANKYSQSNIITLTMDWDVAVTYTDAQIDVTAGTVVANSFSGSGQSYSVQIQATTQGQEVTVSLAQVTTDSSNSYKFTWDQTTPSIVSFNATTPSLSDNGPTNQHIVILTAIFDEAVVLTASSLLVAGATAGTVNSVTNISSSTWELNVTYSGADGVVTATLDNSGGTIKDLAGNSFTGTGGVFHYTYDTQAPTLSVASVDVSNNGKTNKTSVMVEFTFSEAPLMFDSSKITPTGASITGFHQRDSTHFNATFGTTPSTPVVVSLVIDGVSDAAGNAVAQQTFGYSFDDVPPTVSSFVATTPSTLANNGRTNLAGVVLTATFNEDVIFPASGLSFNGPNTPVIAQGADAKTWTITIDNSGATEGAYTAALTVGITDLFGNPYAGTDAFVFTYDITAPVLTISSPDVASGDKTNKASILVTFAFNEAPASFIASDITTTGVITPFTVVTVDSNHFNVTFTTAASANTPVAIDVSGVKDAAGNTIAQKSFSYTFDSVAPVLTISSPDVASGDKTNKASILVTFAFDEAPASFAASDITTTGVITPFTVVTVDTNHFNVTFTTAASANTPVSIDVSGVKDAAGNTIAQKSFSYTFDNVAPTHVSFAATTPVLVDNARTNAATVVLTAVFSEDVTVSSGGITFDGPNTPVIAQASGDAKTWTFTIDNTGATSGTTYTATLTSSITDLYGNAFAGGVSFRFIYDTTAPVLTITSPDVVANGFTNKAAVLVSFAFDEAPASFDSSFITATGVTDTKPFTITTVDSNHFNITFNTAASANTAVSIAVAGVQDVAGNTIASVTFSYTFDSVQPTVAYTSSQVNDGLASVAPLTVRLTFSEDVKVPVVGDITITGTITGTPQLNEITAKRVYDLVFSPSANGAVSLSTAGQDPAGNSLVANSFAFNFDTVNPTATFIGYTVAAGGFTNAAKAVVGVRFSKDIRAFDASFLDLTNTVVDTVDTIQAGREFNVTLTPTANSAVSIVIKDVLDIAGNAIAVGAFSYSFTQDNTLPTVTLASTDVAQSAVTLKTSVKVTATFNEPVTALTTVANLDLVGCTASITVQSTSVYDIILTNFVQGTVSVTLKAVTDRANNVLAAGNAYSFEYDGVKPTAILSSAEVLNGGLTKEQVVSVTVTFDESVTFDNAKVTSQVNLNSAVVAGTGPYTIALTATATGPVSFIISGVPDVAGNIMNDVTFAYYYDGTAPTLNSFVSFSPSGLATNGNTNATSVTLRATFSESVNLTTSDVTISPSNSATVSSVALVGTKAVWDVTLTGLTETTITVAFSTSSLVDQAGNAYSATGTATNFIFTFDSTAPTATFSPTVTVTNAAVAFSVTFSEAVSNMALGAIVVSNGAASLFVDQGGNQYDFTVTPSGASGSTVSVSFAGVTDLAGNPTISSTSFVYDTVAPAISAVSVANPSALSRNGFFTKSSPITVTVTFSENVASYTLAATNGATTSNAAWTTANTVLQFEVASSSSISTAITVTATDAAGNTATSLAVADGDFDLDAPTATITGISPVVVDSGNTNSSAVTIKVLFDEPVSGFVVGKIAAATSAGTASVSSFTTVSTSEYTAVVTVTGSQTAALTVTVAADAAIVDRAGNSFAAAASFAYNYDSVSPLATLTITSPTYVAASLQSKVDTVTYTATFSKPVTGFTESSITVTGGSVVAGSLAGSGPYPFDVKAAAAEAATTVSIPASVAITDSTGNVFGTASNSLAFTYTQIAPTISSFAALTSGVTSGGYANVLTVQFQVSFSQVVTFALTDITATTTAGTVSASGLVSSLGGTTYTFNVVATSEGVVSVSIPASASVANAATIGLATGSSVFSYTIDQTAPVASAVTQSTQALLTTGTRTTYNALTFTFNFNEPVLGVTQGAIQNVVTNGVVTFDSSAAPAYTVTVTASTAGVETFFNWPALTVTDRALNGVTIPGAGFRFTYAVASTASVTCPASNAVGTNFACTVVAKDSAGNSLATPSSTITAALTQTGATFSSITPAFGSSFTATFAASATSQVATVTLFGNSHNVVLFDTPDTVTVACNNGNTATITSSLTCVVSGTKSAAAVYFNLPSLTSSPAGLSFSPSTFALPQTSFSVTVQMPAVSNKYTLGVTGFAAASVDLYATGTFVLGTFTCDKSSLALNEAATCTVTTQASVFVAPSVITVVAPSPSITVSALSPSTPSPSFTFTATAGSAAANTGSFNLVVSTGVVSIVVYTTPDRAVLSCDTFTMIGSTANCVITPFVGETQVAAQPTQFAPSSNLTSAVITKSWNSPASSFPFTVTFPAGAVTGPVVVNSGFSTLTTTTINTWAVPSFVVFTCPQYVTKSAVSSCRLDSFDASFAPVFVLTSGGVQYLNFTSGSATLEYADPAYGTFFNAFFTPTAVSSNLVLTIDVPNAVTNSSSAMTVLETPTSLQVICDSQGALVGSSGTCRFITDKATTSNVFTILVSGPASATIQLPSGASNDTVIGFTPSGTGRLNITGVLVNGASSSSVLVAYRPTTSDELSFTCPDFRLAPGTADQAIVTCTALTVDGIYTTVAASGITAAVVAPSGTSTAVTVEAQPSAPFTESVFTLKTAISGTLTLASSTASLSKAIAVLRAPSTTTSTVVCNATVVKVGELVSCKYTPKNAAGAVVLVDATSVVLTNSSGFTVAALPSPSTGYVSSVSFMLLAVSVSDAASSLLVQGVTHPVSLVVQKTCVDFASCDGYKAEAAVATLRINQPFPAADKQDEFKTNFTNDLVAAGVPRDRISITDLTPGSVIVTFTILPSSTSPTAPSASSLLNNLQTQLNTPGSPLLSGSVTSATTGIVAQPSVLYEYCTTVTPAQLVVQGTCKQFSNDYTGSGFPGYDITLTIIILAIAAAAAVAIFIYKKRAAEKQPPVTESAASTPGEVPMQTLPSATSGLNTTQSTAAPEEVVLGASDPAKLLRQLRSQHNLASPRGQSTGSEVPASTSDASLPQSGSRPSVY